MHRVAPSTNPALGLCRALGSKGLGGSNSVLTIAFLRPRSDRCPKDSLIQARTSCDETCVVISKHQRCVNRSIRTCKEYQSKHGWSLVSVRQRYRHDSRRFLSWLNSREAYLPFRDLNGGLPAALQ